MQPQMLAQAQQLDQQVMSNVTPEQLELATPCAEWNVAQLIEHMIGAQYWGLAAMTGQEQSETGQGACQGDFCGAFQSAAEQAAAAFSAEGALEKTVNPGFGDMPGSAMLGLALTDTFTHTWDLAKATGQDTDLAPPMAQGILAASKQMIQPSFRSEEGSIFGLEQQAPEGASAADQLAAFLGRQV